MSSAAVNFMAAEGGNHGAAGTLCRLAHAAAHGVQTQSSHAVPTLRPVRADDAQAMRVFVEQSLGASSRRNRFHAAVNRCSDRLAAHLAGADGQRHVAWVACVPNQEGDGDTIVGEARYVVVGPTGNRAELAVSVADTWQGSGVADLLMQALLQSAAMADLGSLFGDVLAGNQRMQDFMRRHGFAATAHDEQDGECVQLACAVRRRAPARLWPVRSTAAGHPAAPLWWQGLLARVFAGGLATTLS